MLVPKLKKIHKKYLWIFETVIDGEVQPVEIGDDRVFETWAQCLEYMYFYNLHAV
jgi:hypothetical protein